MARILFLFPLLVAYVLQTCLQENLIHEDVGVCGGDGGGVCEGFPCARVVLRVDEGDGEGVLCVGIRGVTVNGVAQDGDCLRCGVFCEEGEPVVVACASFRYAS